jgi:hypothetical protein
LDIVEIIDNMVCIITSKEIINEVITPRFAQKVLAIVIYFPSFSFNDFSLIALPIALNIANKGFSVIFIDIVIINISIIVAISINTNKSSDFSLVCMILNQKTENRTAININNIYARNFIKNFCNLS